MSRGGIQPSVFSLFICGWGRVYVEEWAFNSWQGLSSHSCGDKSVKERLIQKRDVGATSEDVVEGTFMHRAGMCTSWCKVFEWITSN